MWGNRSGAILPLNQQKHTAPKLISAEGESIQMYTSAQLPCRRRDTLLFTSSWGTDHLLAPCDWSHHREAGSAIQPLPKPLELSSCLPSQHKLFPKCKSATVAHKHQYVQLFKVTLTASVEMPPLWYHSNGWCFSMDNHHQVNTAPLHVLNF